MSAVRLMKILLPIRRSISSGYVTASNSRRNWRQARTNPSGTSCESPPIQL